MRDLFKTFLIFTSLFTYLFRSYKKNENITKLKQQWALQILKNFDFEIIIQNKISERQKEKQLILVGNHISYLDIIVLMAIHPEVVFLSKKEVKRWPIIGTGAKRIGTLFVDRNCKKSRSSAKEQIKTLFADKSKKIHLAGFPSGTTCMHELMPWKKGLFEIAEQTQVVVQPFRITYSPLRECAYIDQDNLFLSLKTLFKTKNKKIIFEWGQNFEVDSQVIEMQKQITRTQIWVRSEFALI